jgi:ATP-dependent protease Clp ATPase subunit
MYFAIQVVRNDIQTHRDLITCRGIVICKRSNVICTRRNVICKRSVVICNRCIVVCKQYLDMNFMNVVATSFHNISKDLDFKPDDNCVSPLGQTEGDRPVSTLLLWQL